MSVKTKKVIGGLFGVFLLLMWQVLSMVIGNSFILPSPLAVLQNLRENSGEIFLVHFPATMQVVVVGAILSIVIGVGFALLMDASTIIAGAVYPILTVTQTIPVMCLAPVLVLWLGYTMKMRVLVVVLANFFSVTVDMYDGLQSTDEEKSRLLSSFHAKRWQQLVMLRLPSAMPHFFSALHVVIVWSVVGAAVAEWLGASRGLGTYSRYCLSGLDAAGLIAPLLVLTVVALVLNKAVKLIEYRVLKWRDER
ncbi:MAG: ABC transporter permease [Lachnospiraceae bacterium]|nr:ABC transporter permease [Lachnospiraceae bacterium]